MKKTGKKKNTMMTIMVTAVLAMFFPGCKTVYAESVTKNIEGELYEFDTKSKYELSSESFSQKIVDEGKLGTFSISGDVKEIADVNGFPAYRVQHTDVTNREASEGIVKLSYVLKSELTNAEETDWHIANDKSSVVNGEKLDDKIQAGTIILQTSLDGEKWITDVTKNNIAGDKSEYDTNFYNTKGIQQVNGCYYRVIVAYKAERRVDDTKIGPITQKHYEEKKYAEIYEWYLIDSLEDSEDAILSTVTPRKEMGQRINTGKDNGFSGNESITDKDPHFGWDIGTFFLNGYTREQVVGEGEDPIFLKTVGDRVTLWFTLKEDIRCLNGKNELTICEDKNGYDQYFGIEKTNFKHGVLIIRFTDFEGKVHEPVIYTDYLEACARTGADTKVELFEEGDYEVALDYEIKNSSGFDSYTNYRIFFKFKIRNGNCMVYPFDAGTGAELSDNALTENGFELDLAKSRYLTIDIVRDAVKKENDRYLLDTRVNAATQEGKIYTTEGVYTFTVKNPSTGESTTKTIYVGKIPIYRALAGGKNIEEINELLDQGGQLLDDGSIVSSERKSAEESVVTGQTEVEDNNMETEIESAADALAGKSDTAQTGSETETDVAFVSDNIAAEQDGMETPGVTFFVVMGIVIVTLIGVFILRQKNRRQERAADTPQNVVDIQEDEQ